MNNKYITIKIAAEMIGVSELTLRNWDNNGKFPAGRHPISNYRVYNIDDVNTLIDAMGRSVLKNRSKNSTKKLKVVHLDP